MSPSGGFVARGCGWYALNMPELPDLTLYLERLEALTTGRRITRIRVRSPFVVRTHTPRITAIEGMQIHGYERLGKRIIFVLDDAHFLVLHLMIAGRLRLKKPGFKGTRDTLALFDLCDGADPVGTLSLTEASKKKRASLHLVCGRDALADHDRGGMEVLDASLPQFRSRLVLENHTLKRALTDPRLFSGIGNAYSDEILHRAGLSPIRWTHRLTEPEITTLHAATKAVLTEWIQRFRAEIGTGFPDKVTAFRPEMAVHGRYREPCPVCQTPVQRIVYAENETNYCPTCQTGGRLLADRALSRLMKKDWPRTLEGLEEKKRR